MQRRLWVMCAVCWQRLKTKATDRGDVRGACAVGRQDGRQGVVSAHKTFHYIGVTHCFLGIELSKMNMEIVRPVLT